MPGTFGGRFYAELERLGATPGVIGIELYADIQRLKAADRAEVAQLFERVSDEAAAHARRDTPEQLAAYVDRVVRPRYEARQEAQFWLFELWQWLH